MIALVVIMVLATCWPTLRALHARWTDVENLGDTHGYLIAAVVIYLFWRSARSAGTGTMRSPRPVWRSWFALVMAGVTWAFMVRAGLMYVQFLILPALLWLAIRAALGPEAARRNLFAVGYLYFAMPVWGAVNPLLQWGTVYVVRGLLTLAGVPAYFEGNMVQVPAGTFEIAGGCSGLHFFVVALAIAALMGEMRNDRARHRIQLLVVAAALAVVANWLRVFTIILVGHHTHMQHYLVAESHYGYGWALFAIAMVGFFLLERRLESGSAASARSAASSPSSAGLAQVWPVAGTLLIMGCVAGLQWLSARPASALLQPLAPQPGWYPVMQDDADWQPFIRGADTSARVRYEFVDGGTVDRHEYLLLAQRQNKELGGYTDSVTGDFSVQSSRTGKLAHASAHLYEVVATAGARYLVAASYVVQGNYQATPVPAQLRYAGLSLLGLRSVPASVVVWRVPCADDCTAAERLLGEFIAAMEPEV